MEIKQNSLTGLGSETFADNSAASSSSAGAPSVVDASACLTYRFMDVSLGLRVSVTVPRNANCDRESLWLCALGPLFRSSSSAFAAYRSAFVHRNRKFSSEHAAWFEQCRQNPDKALLAKLSMQSSEISSAELLTLKQTAKRLQRRIGARKLKRKVTQVQTEAARVGDALIYKSDRGRQRERLIQSSAPSVLTWTDTGMDLESKTSASGRRVKRKIYENVTMPTAAPIRSMRQDDKQHNSQLSAQERGFSYLLESGNDSDNLTVSEQPPPNLSDLAGLFFSPEAQLIRLLEHSAKRGLLTKSALGDNGAVSTLARLRAWFGADGVTPANCSVCAHFCRLLDPSKALFVKGYSPLMRIVVFWGLESQSRRIATLRNRFLGILASKL